MQLLVDTSYKFSAQQNISVVPLSLSLSLSTVASSKKLPVRSWKPTASAEWRASSLKMKAQSRTGLLFCAMSCGFNRGFGLEMNDMDKQLKQWMPNSTHWMSPACLQPIARITLVIIYIYISCWINPPVPSTPGHEIVTLRNQKLVDTPWGLQTSSLRSTGMEWSTRQHSGGGKMHSVGIGPDYLS